MENTEQIADALEEVNRQGLLLNNQESGLDRLTALWAANQDLTHQIENKIAELRDWMPNLFHRSAEAKIEKIRECHYCAYEGQEEQCPKCNSFSFNKYCQKRRKVA